MGSDSEDEVSTLSDPMAWAATPLTLGHGLRLIRSYGEGSASSDPRGLDFISPVRQGEISALPIPWGSDLLPDKSSGPRVGPEPLQPLWHGGARPEAHLGCILMRLAIASGHAGRLTSPIASTCRHCATNSLPNHHPTSVNQRQLTGTVLPAPRMASIKGPFDHSVRSDGMEDKNDAQRPHACCSGQQDPI